MNKLLIALVAAALPAAAHADADKADKGGKPPREARTRANPCAAFGPGFVQLEGSATCVKIGGAISIEAGDRR